MKRLEIVVQSDYQDIYRISDGVLLVINKFNTMKIEGVKYPSVHRTDKSNSRIYKKGCQNGLKKLIKEYKHEESWCDPEWSIPIGSVLYHDVPVEIVPENEWEYQIKTTGEMFKGNSYKMNELLNSILQIIKTGEIENEI